jgi:hypothetical protein
MLGSRGDPSKFIGIKRRNALYNLPYFWITFQIVFLIQLCKNLEYISKNLAICCC